MTKPCSRARNREAIADGVGEDELFDRAARDLGGWSPWRRCRGSRRRRRPWLLRSLQATAISMRVPPEIVKSSTMRTFLPFYLADHFPKLGASRRGRGGSCCRRPPGPFLKSANRFACLPQPTSGAATTRSGMSFLRK